METDRNVPVYMRKDMYYCALVLSILLGCSVIASFFVTGTEYSIWFLFPFLWLLMVAFILSAYHKEYDSFDAFFRRCCKPLFILAVLLALAAFFNLFISVFVMEGGGPEYRDGAYLLTYKTKVLRELTREEYLRFRRIEARMLMGFPLVFSLIALTYFSARVPRPLRGERGAND